MNNTENVSYLAKFIVWPSKYASHTEFSAFSIQHLLKKYTDDNNPIIKTFFNSFSAISPLYFLLNENGFER